MKRGVALLLVIAMVLVGVGAVGYLVSRAAADDYDPVVLAAPAGTPPADQPPDPSLARYYGQRLSWEPCGATQCTTLDVPLDYDQPDGETIGIHVVRRPADDQDQRVGSLLVNPGGPGEAGSTVAANASSYLGDPLLRYLDVVGFDPRGTGQSDPLDCLDDADLDTYLAADPEPETPTEVRDYVHEFRALGRGCARLSGDLASHVSTEESARDMDVLRAALGDQVTAYLGFSYGTELGATYADALPGPHRPVRARRCGRPDPRHGAGRAHPGHRLRDRAAGLRRELPGRDRLLLPRRLAGRGAPAHP